MEKERICIKFFIEPTAKNIFNFFKGIPKKHRAWEAKKIFVSNFKSTDDTTSEKSATSKPIRTEF